jgi:selenocysteine lyase/cysteine desulfurase
MLKSATDEFSLPSGVTYLNCAYMAPLAKTVAAAGTEAIQYRAYPGRLSSSAFFTDVARLKERFAALIGSTAERIAIVPSVSYGMATVLRNVPVAFGSNIVVVENEFPSIVLACDRKALESGADLRTVAAPNKLVNRAAEWSSRIIEAIDERTALVAISPVHWQDGTLFDLEGVGARAREVGAALVLDGTQAVGAMPLQVRELKADALICAGYKWLLGPYGVSLAYLGPLFDTGTPLEEVWTARAGSDDFSQLTDYRAPYLPGCERYDMGERASFILVPMMIAALEQLLRWTPNRIASHCADLTERIARGVAEIGFTASAAGDRAPHILGLTIPRDVDRTTLKAALDHRNISVSWRGDTLRISPHVYNSDTDAQSLMDALASIVVR